MGMGLLGAYFIFDCITLIFFLCVSFCCSPVHIFSLSFLFFYSCPAVIGPSHSSGLFRFFISTILLYVDVHYRDS